MPRLRTCSRITPALAILACAITAYAGGGARLLGPTPYLSQADSPFPLGTGSFCLEDFEGAGFDVPGVTGNGSVIGPSSLTDSVDGDDGAIDGSGTGEQSYFGGGAVWPSTRTAPRWGRRSPPRSATTATTARRPRIASSASRIRAASPRSS